MGYSFIDSMENGFVKFKDKLLEVLLKDPLVRSVFAKRVRGRGLGWVQVEAHEGVLTDLWSFI
jgi:hypothetical protein